MKPTSEMFAEKAADVARAIFEHDVEPVGGNVAFNTEKAAKRIAAAIAEAVIVERAVWAPLYKLSLDIMILHEGIMAAWRDMALPATIETIENLREDLLAACKRAREHTELTGAEISKITPPPVG